MDGRVSEWMDGWMGGWKDWVVIEMTLSSVFDLQPRTLATGEGAPRSSSGAGLCLGGLVVWVRAALGAVALTPSRRAVRSRGEVVDMRPNVAREPATGAGGGAGGSARAGAGAREALGDVTLRAAAVLLSGGPPPNLAT